MNNYIEEKDTHEARIENQNKTILEGYEKKLKWYEKNYGPYINERGLKNWKNLFQKPTMWDVLIFIIIVMVLLGALAYNRDIQTCQDTLKRMPREVCEACSEFMLMKDEIGDDLFDDFNISNIKFTNDG